MPRCSVLTCNIITKGHKFPKDPSQNAKWLKAIQRDDWKPSRHSHVCKYHFLTGDYSKSNRSRDRLRKNAVPSQFSWNSNISFEGINDNLRKRRRKIAIKSSLVILKPSEVNKNYAMAEQGNQDPGIIEERTDQLENSSEVTSENIHRLGENITNDVTENRNHVSTENDELLSENRFEQMLQNNIQLSENDDQQAERTPHRSLEKADQQVTDMNYQILENGSHVSINVEQLTENMSDQTMKIDHTENGIDDNETVAHRHNFDETEKEVSYTAECRACLLQLRVDSLFSLFQAWAPTWEGLGPTIAEDLSTFANVQLSETDIHSNFICYTCCDKLWNACHFKMLVQENDKLLKQRIPDDSSREWPKPIQMDKSISVFKNNFPFDVDIKQEVLSDEELGNTEDGYADTNLMDIKVEPEEIQEPSPIINGVTSLKEVPGEDEPNGPHWKGLPAIKEEPMSESEDTVVSLECMLCTRSFNSITGLKAHVIAQHSYKAVGRGGEAARPPPEKHVCALCRRTFASSTDLMVHETCHNKYACYVCSAKFETFPALTRHRKRCKALAKRSVKRPKMLDDVIRPQTEDSLLKERDPNPTSNDVTTPVTNQSSLYSCPHCSKLYADPHNAKIHQEVHHSKEIDGQQTEDETAPMEVEMLESMSSEGSKSGKLDFILSDCGTKVCE